MYIFSTAVTGLYNISLPQWGRSFWQDPNDGELFLAFASGTSRLAFIRSTNSGNGWSEPEDIGPIDDFSVHNNFDTFMDPRGHVHCVFRYNDSGCYQFLGKQSGGGWTKASGQADPVGFCTAGDSGTAPGFQGSVSVKEFESGFDLPFTTFPTCIVGAKDAANDVDLYYMGYPHSSGFFLKETIGEDNAGTNGGYPITYADGDNGNGAGVAYYDDVDRKIIPVIRNSSFDFWHVQGFFPRYLGSGEEPFCGKMGIGSGTLPYTGLTSFTCSSSGNDLWGNYQISGGQTFTRLDSRSSVLYDGQVVETATIDWRDQIPQSGIYGVGGDFPGSGTNCDFSFDSYGNMYWYWQQKNSAGHQCIVRTASRPFHDGTSYRIYTAPADIYPSGMRFTSQVSHDVAGGYNGRCFYKNFKALKHPTAPSGNDFKSQLIVTNSYTSTYPSGSNLVIWNMDESPAVRSHYNQPYYQIDYTATSGDENIFVGVSDAFFHADIPLMFDGDVNTYGLVGSGSYLTLEMDKSRVIDRIEIVGQSSSSAATNNRDIGQIDLYASHDGTNFSYIQTIPSGNASLGTRLRRFTANELEVEVQPGSQGFYQLIDPISARYVRLNFTTAYTTSGRRISEIRLFGPSTTAHQTTTADHTYFNVPQVRRQYIERFRRKRGELPATWRSYGDFTWYTVASGDFTHDVVLPTQEEPSYANGLVPSGLFYYLAATNGNGDGFSLISEPAADASGLVSPVGPIPSSGIYPGSSGVVEVDLDISVEEFNANKRYIAFDYRLDQNQDDVFEFSTIDEFNTETVHLSVTGSFNNWLTHTTTLDASTYTARWKYIRGSTTDPFTYGAAWIDNVSGVPGPPLWSVNGFIKGEQGVATGIINGYMNTNYSEQIYGYMYGAPFDSSINGYLLSAVDPDFVSSINGYLYANTDGSINGYMLAVNSGEFAVTYPTGSINGYMLVWTGWDESNINGILLANWDQGINGYIIGASAPGDIPSGQNQIFGYVKAFDAESYINGIVNTYGQSVFSGSIAGYLNARFGIGDQVINGYMFTPSGDVSYINSYLPGWNGNGEFFIGPQSIINGYLSAEDLESVSINGYLMGNYPISSIWGYLGSEALVPSGGGLVGGGPGGGGSSTSNVIPGTNWINGYLKAHDGFQQINGYLMAPPGYWEHIFGYVSAGADDSIIHGFLVGHEEAASSINAYMSGAGFVGDEINGWLFGISGTFSDSINGFVIGSNFPISTIYGTMIGTTSGVNSKEACPAHNYFPLPATLVASIPTGNFFN